VPREFARFPRTFGKKEELIFLGKEVSEERNYSEHTAQSIDQQVSAFVEDARATAEKILTAKRATLDRIAKTLLEKETLEKDEFDSIVKGDVPQVKKEETKSASEKSAL